MSHSGASSATNEAGTAAASEKDHNPYVPLGFEQRRDWIESECRASIGMFAVKSKNNKNKKKLDAETQSLMNRYLERSHRLLNFIEYGLTITPRYHKVVKIVLEICIKDEHRFPETFRQRAQALRDEFKDSDQGAIPTPEEVSDVGSDEDINDGADTNRTVSIRKPPHDDPIWGVNRTYHGLALSVGGQRKRVAINPDYKDQKSPASVSGDNGLRMGQWFPSQMSALFHGAHGKSQAGISGNYVYGAYSIVVSGEYEEVDKE